VVSTGGRVTAAAATSRQYEPTYTRLRDATTPPITRHLLPFRKRPLGFVVCDARNFLYGIRTGWAITSSDPSSIHHLPPLPTPPGLPATTLTTHTTTTSCAGGGRLVLRAAGCFGRLSKRRTRVFVNETHIPTLPTPPHTLHTPWRVLLFLHGSFLYISLRFQHGPPGLMPWYLSFHTPLAPHYISMVTHMYFMPSSLPDMNTVPPSSWEVLPSATTTSPHLPSPVPPSAPPFGQP